MRGERRNTRRVLQGDGRADLNKRAAADITAAIQLRQKRNPAALNDKLMHFALASPEQYIADIFAWYIKIMTEQMQLRMQDEVSVFKQYARNKHQASFHEPGTVPGLPANTPPEYPLPTNPHVPDQQPFAQPGMHSASEHFTPTLSNLSRPNPYILTT